MHNATPQDTYDHIFGSGALQYEWWLSVDIAGVDLENGRVVDAEWVATVVAENGEDEPNSTTQKNVTHECIMDKAKDVVNAYLLGAPIASEALVRECARLYFDPASVDFDANSADEMLQLLVLGKGVFG